MVRIKALVRILTKCNIRCRHCYVSGDGARDFQLNIGELKMIVDKLVKARACSVVFTGGQPTLAEDDLLEIIRYTKTQKDRTGYPKKIEVTTNAVIGRDEATARWWLANFRNSGLDRIRLSCDEYHREFLPKEFEDRIIALAGEYGIGIKIMEVAGPGSRIDNNIETEGKKIFALRPGGRANSEELRPAWDNAARCRIAKAYEKMNEKVTLFIHSTGDVYLCNVGVDKELSLGNILHEEIEDIFSGKKSEIVEALKGDVAGLGKYFGCSDGETTDLVGRFGRCGACSQIRSKALSPKK